MLDLRLDNWTVLNGHQANQFFIHNILKQVSIVCRIYLVLFPVSKQLITIAKPTMQHQQPQAPFNTQKSESPQEKQAASRGSSNQSIDRATMISQLCPQLKTGAQDLDDDVVEDACKELFASKQKPGSTKQIDNGGASHSNCQDSHASTFSFQQKGSSLALSNLNANDFNQQRIQLEKALYQINVLKKKLKMKHKCKITFYLKQSDFLLQKSIGSEEDKRKRMLAKIIDRLQRVFQKSINKKQPNLSAGEEEQKLKQPSKSSN